jgi:uncharacterized protein
MRDVSNIPTEKDRTDSRLLQRSRYNYFVERNDGMLSYNARTGTFARLSDDVARMLRGEGPITESEDTTALLEMGFLHRGDEYDRIVATYLDGKSTGTGLELTIVPTMACNRTCGYCYQTEYRNERVMSTSTQDATIRYATARVSEGWRKVSCTFFGGEPLLARSIVLDMAYRLRRAVGEGGGQLLPMAIITNGTLLDEDTARALAEAGVAEAQVSFDALIDDGRDHRGVIDSSRSPSTILQNLIAAAPHLELRIRINVSVENRKDVPEMLDILREHGFNRLAYLARVTDFETESGAITDSEGKRHRLPILKPHTNPDTLNRPEFAAIEQELLLKQPDALEKIVHRLTPKQHFCGATAGNLFVIDPDGNVSRCWNSAGSRSEAMGNVHDVANDFSGTEIARAWNRISPFIYPQCSSCKVLPLCMGGCSHPRLMMGSPRAPCEAIRQQIQTFVDHLGKCLVLSPPAAMSASGRGEPGEQDR